MDSTQSSSTNQYISNTPMDSSDRLTKNPALAAKIAKMRLTLMPLYPLPIGPPHHTFPKTLLHFCLLTEDELDSIADYYSQSKTDVWTYEYPCPMGWDAEFFADPSLSVEQRVTIKRRKLGKFIGMRGCSTPIDEVALRLQLAEARIQRQIEQAKAEEKVREKGWMRWYGV